MNGTPIKVFDSFRRVWRWVYPVLVFAYADTPARRAWALTCGHTGRSGCDKCGIRGVRVLPSGEIVSFTVFVGYAGPTAAMVYDEAKHVRLS